MVVVVAVVAVVGDGVDVTVVVDAVVVDVGGDGAVVGVGLGGGGGGRGRRVLLRSLGNFLKPGLGLLGTGAVRESRSWYWSSSTGVLAVVVMSALCSGGLGSVVFLSEGL